MIFTLGNGATIKDSGKQIWFGNDKSAQKGALLFAKMKWGENLQVKENKIVFVVASKEKLVEMERKKQERGLGAGF